VTLLASSLFIQITFFTSLSHVDIPSHESVAVNQQIGIPLLLAALAALVGEVKLASNNRCADQRDRIEARSRATEERNRSGSGLITLSLIQASSPAALGQLLWAMAVGLGGGLPCSAAPPCPEPRQAVMAEWRPKRRNGC
jgi:hypothetical protein